MIGWREEIFLPELGAGGVVAKIDTGAKISALHAESISVADDVVKFSVVMGGRERHCVAPLASQKRIKSSNGHSELRPVIETVIQVGEHLFPALVTLTNRTDMGVPMLLGRISLKGRFLVHPARSFIQSRKKKLS